MSHAEYFDIVHDADQPTLMSIGEWFMTRVGDFDKLAFITGENDGEPMMWDSFEEEMILCSREHPEVLFIAKITEFGLAQAKPHTRLWIRGGKCIKHQPTITWPDSPDLTDFGKASP